ncbi:hypothetical protein V8C86DRAFT_657407 [Haematococcus lacustris]
MRELTPHQAGPLPLSLTQHLLPSPAQAVGRPCSISISSHSSQAGVQSYSNPGMGVSWEQQQQQQQQVPHAWEASSPRTTPAPALAPDLGQSHHLPALASTSPGPTSTPLTLQTPDHVNSTTATALSPPPHPPPVQPAAPGQAGQLRQGAVEAARRGGRGGAWLQVVSALVNHTRTALLLAWLLLLGASSLAVLLALAQAGRITYCTSPRTPLPAPGLPGTRPQPASPPSVSLPCCCCCCCGKPPSPETSRLLPRLGWKPNPSQGRWLRPGWSQRKGQGQGQVEEL